MDSVVSICNNALTVLGARKIMLLDEGSTEANNCKTVFWDCVESTLQAHNWSFATSQEELAPLSENYQGWDYAYRYPVDCLRIIALVDPNICEDWHYPINFSEYTVQLSLKGDSRVLLSSHDRVILKYTRFIKNISVYSAAFKRTLVWQLTVALGRQLKGAASNEVAAYEQAYRIELSKARSIDSSESIIKPIRENKYRRGRR